MCNISKHYSKKERKCDSCENTWVYLLISRNSICICDHLRRSNITICSKCSWRIIDWDFMYRWRWNYFTDFKGNSFDLFFWYIRVGYVKLLSSIKFVETLIKSLFFPKKNSPSFNTNHPSHSIHKLTILFSTHFSQT